MARAQCTVLRQLQGLQKAETGYLLQIPWIQSLLGPPDGVLAELAVWVGLRLNKPSRFNLESALRTKFLLLLAVNLKQRSLR